MKKSILYYILVIGVVFSCKKEDITKQHFNSTNHSTDSIRAIRNLTDSVLNIINNPVFGAFPDKIRTMNDNSFNNVTNFYYYNDGRIAKISSFGLIISPMGYESHLIFSYQPDGFTINEYSKIGFSFNPETPYDNSVISVFKTNANNFITNVKSKLVYSNIDTNYYEFKINYINNKVNKIEKYFNNVLNEPYYNNYIYDANDNLIFKSLNTHLFSYGIPSLDSVFYTYTDFTDELGLNSDIHMSYPVQTLPLNYTGYSIRASDKLAKTMNYVLYENQTNIPLHSNVTYDYEFNASNKLIKIYMETKSYDQNNIETNSYNNSTDITYY